MNRRELLLTAAAASTTATLDGLLHPVKAACQPEPLTGEMLQIKETGGFTPLKFTVENGRLVITNWKIYNQNRGITLYYQDGKLHREDGPALVYDNGSMHWYQNNELHREDGPALVTDCTVAWYKHGKRHREGGPAVILPNMMNWKQNGKFHREDGPASIILYGSNRVDLRWFWQGEQTGIAYCNNKEKLEDLTGFDDLNTMLHKLDISQSLFDQLTLINKATQCNAVIS